MHIYNISPQAQGKASRIAFYIELVISKLSLTLIANIDQILHITYCQTLLES